MRKFGLVAASLFAATTLAAAPAFAEETKFMAMLSGAEEVPPVETGGTGSANVTWNSETKELSWSIDFAGLSGPATAAHFHGPAGPGRERRRRSSPLMIWKVRRRAKPR